jgi:hypothetical protein
MAHQQPPSQAFFKLMHAIARGGLGGLRKLPVNASQ